MRALLLVILLLAGCGGQATVEQTSNGSGGAGGEQAGGSGGEPPNPTWCPDTADGLTGPGLEECEACVDTLVESGTCPDGGATPQAVIDAVPSLANQGGDAQWCEDIEANYPADVFASSIEYYQCRVCGPCAASCEAQPQYDGLCDL